MEKTEKQILDALLDFYIDAQQEELINLRLKLIRDQQAPILKKLVSQFPDSDTQSLRIDLLHEELKNIRRKRLNNLEKMIEGFYTSQENKVKIEIPDPGMMTSEDSP